MILCVDIYLLLFLIMYFVFISELLVFEREKILDRFYVLR